MRFAIKGAIFTLAVCLSIAPAVGTDAAASTGDPASYVVEIKDFAFSPQTLVASVGSKVTWKNRDEEPHRIAETNQVFTSPPLDTNQVFSYEFKTAGKYKYFCTLHPHMTGEIIVEGKPSGALRRATGLKKSSASGLVRS